MAVGLYLGTLESGVCRVTSGSWPQSQEGRQWWEPQAVYCGSPAVAFALVVPGTICVLPGVARTLPAPLDPLPSSIPRLFSSCLSVTVVVSQLSLSCTPLSPVPDEVCMVWAQSKATAAQLGGPLPGPEPPILPLPGEWQGRLKVAVLCDAGV